MHTSVFTRSASYTLFSGASVHRNPIHACTCTYIVHVHVYTLYMYKCTSIRQCSHVTSYCSVHRLACMCVCGGGGGFRETEHTFDTFT